MLSYHYYITHRSITPEVDYVVECLELLEGGDKTIEKYCTYLRYYNYTYEIAKRLLTSTRLVGTCEYHRY